MSDVPFTPPSDLIARRVGDTMVLIRLNTNRIYELNATGARIWELIDTPRDVEAVCRVLQDEYDVTPEICRAEVEAFLKDMVKHGAIAVDPPAAQIS